MVDFQLGAWLLVALHALVVLIATVFVSANRRPSAAIAWVLAIIFIPFLGVLIFLLVGVGRLPKARREKQREVNDLILARTDGLDQVSHRDEWPAWLGSAVRLNRNLGALPMVGGNRVELLPDYEDSITRMAQAVDEATEFVHVQYYILVLDTVTQPFFDALARAVKRGWVTVSKIGRAHV